ncbi:MAG: halocyanin domain-containing protein [Haloarculaceae archaeon]
MQRRTYLAIAGGTLATLAGCSGGSASDDEYGDWFSNVDNYDGDVDRTGRDVVTVSVGAGDGFEFSPAAILIEPGTTVAWEWTGRGGQHNVVERNGAFASDYHTEEGTVFEYTLENSGLFPYYCEPHRDLGMKGGVRVE